MSSTPRELRIFESTSIAPPPGTVSGHATLPLTFFDVLWMHHHHPSVERLFFYRYPHLATGQFFSSLVPSLKSSLSLALEKFYPLAGNLQLAPGTQDKYEICYIDGDSVSFTVAQFDGKFEDFSGNHERECSRFQCFIPELPKSDKLQPLFSVQVTVFPEQGVAIGIAIHHALCDGMSSMQFMQEWAAACRSQTQTSSDGPIIDRTLVSDPSDLYSNFHHGMLEFKKAMSSMSVPAPPVELMLATFTLSQERIQKLKQLVLNDAKERNVSFRCSTLVVAVAYMVVGYVQAKGFDKIGKFCFGLPADYRARIQPSLPAEYFGNCVWFIKAKMEVSDLIRDNGVALAAEAIGKEIERLRDGLKGAENWIESLKSISGIPVLGAAGSPKFKVYSVDFGWGKPEKVEIVSATKAGSMSLAESRDEPGGVEIGLALPRREMDFFSKYFENGLKQF
jgi:Transferase family